jgi:penicillin-binding protein 1A
LCVKVAMAELSDNQNKYYRIAGKSWNIFRIILLSLFLFIAALQMNFLWLFGGMPGMEDLENPKSEMASEIYSADNMLLGKYFKENRSPVEYDEISPNVINALISTEDVRFYEHSGIDLKGFVAIFWYMLKGDQRGSSTLTQQLAKNLFKTRSQDSRGLLGYVPGLNVFIIKAKEWMMAIQLEKAYSKEEIINMYLNTVDFGSSAYGIKVASETFFSTDPDKLNIQQAATLIGILKATTTYSPKSHPDRALERRNIVLALMQENGILSQSEADSLKKLPLGLKYSVENQNQGNATYFRGYVNSFINNWCKANGKDLYTDGLKIYTTIDSRVQAYAEEAVADHMKGIQKKFFEHWKGKNPWIYENKKEIPGFLEDAAKKTDNYKMLKAKFGEGHDSIKIIMNTPVPMRIFSWDGDIDTVMSPMDSLRYYKHFLHAGFMSMDPFTGAIKAWVGGINFQYFKYDHVKQGKRQPGSAFKPFVYTAAVEKGYSPCFLLRDEPITFTYDENGEKKSWSPRNADWVFTGDSMTMRQAMARSINSIAAHMMRIVGINEVIKYAKKLGISSPLEPVPSLCLGSSDVSVSEMTGAYSAFVNSGIWIEPYFISRIEDSHGNVLLEVVPKRKEALSEQSAYTMVHMLKGGTEERGGTSQALFEFDIFRGNEIGGKTGTTSNHSDGWFMGITRNHVAGMWVGGEDRCIHFRTSEYGEGARLALPIYGRYMTKIYADTSLDIKKGYFIRPKKMNINLQCPYRPEPDLPDSTEIYHEGDLYLEGEEPKEEIP